MLTPSPVEGNGAIINQNQLDMLWSLFRLHPWSYVNEDPFEMAKQLEEQERAMAENNIS